MESQSSFSCDFYQESVHFSPNHLSFQASIPFASNLTSVTAFAMMFGIYYGSVYSLLTSLTISIVGLHRLAFAFGVEMISAGLGYLLAPPLAGGSFPGSGKIATIRAGADSV